MNFGELLAGAGRIGGVAREEAQRLRDYERDRTALAEMRRMEAMRESLARGGVPETPPEMLRFGSLDYGFSEVEPPQPAPAASIAPAAPAAPTATPTAAPAPTEQPTTKPLAELPSLNEEPLTAPGTLSIPRNYQSMTGRQLDDLIRDRRRQIAGSTWLSPQDRQRLLNEVVELERQRDTVGVDPFEADRALVAESKARIAALERLKNKAGKLGTREQAEVNQLRRDITEAEKRLRNAPSVSARPKAGLDVGAPKPAAAVTPEGTDPRFPKPKLISLPPDFDAARMSDVMEHFESSGNPDAVSGAGAIGLMQIQPDTAMKPGVEGANSIFDIALRVPGNPYRADNKKRTKEEAVRLLRIPELNKEFGNEYFKGLFAKYGNVEHALAAYNWGPANTSKWIARGADPAKLPAETRQYVTNIQGAYGRTDFTPSIYAKRALSVTAPAVAVTGASVAEPAATRGIISSAAAAPVAAPQRVEPSAFRAQENAMPETLRQYQQQRAELVRLAKMYQQSGMGAEVQQLRGQIIGMDNDFLRVQGMQGLQEFAYGDPRRLSAVWSAYAGTPIGIQPRSDGTFNLFVGGQRYGEAMSLKQLTDQARRSFDTAYQQRMAEIEATTYGEGVKSSLRMAEERDKQVAAMIKDIYVERAKAAGALDAKRLELRGFDVKPSGMGDGMFVITAKDGSGAWAFNSKPAMQEINGVKVPAYDVFPIKLPGLR